MRIKFIVIATFVLGWQNNSFAQCDLILCDLAPNGDTIPCDRDIDVTQYLENVAVYGLFNPDSVGVIQTKTLYFIVKCVEPFEVDSLTFVLRETVNAESNTYKDIETKVLEVQSDWNYAWIKWKFNHTGLFWMDVRYNDITFGTTLVEIDLQD